MAVLQAIGLITTTRRHREDAEVVDPLSANEIPKIRAELVASADYPRAD
jgi:hypothetical protein